MKKKAEGRRQKAEGKRQKAEGRRIKPIYSSTPPLLHSQFAFQ
jgi:hypothetical protein